MDRPSHCTAAFHARQIPEALLQLRQLLPPSVALWAGGSGVTHAAPLTGIQQFPDLAQGVAALEEWRTKVPA